MSENSTPCRPQGHCQLTGVKSDDRLLDRVIQTVNCEPPVSELFHIFRHDRNKHNLQMVRNFAAVYRPEVLLCLQEHITGLYPQPDESSQHPYLNLTCPFTHTYRIFTTCTLPQVAVFQYAPHRTPTSHTHITHTARPPPHTNYFTYQDWKIPIHISTPSLLHLTTHKTTNSEPAEPKTTPSNLPAFPQTLLLRIKTIATQYG
jgi:hypothetical protein